MKDTISLEEIYSQIKKQKEETKLANDDIIRTMNSNIYSKNIDKLKIKSADFDYENYELILNFDKSKIDRVIISKDEDLNYRVENIKFDEAFPVVKEDLENLYDNYLNSEELHTFSFEFSSIDEKTSIIMNTNFIYMKDLASGLIIRKTFEDEPVSSNALYINESQRKIIFESVELDLEHLERITKENKNYSRSR